MTNVTEQAGEKSQERRRESTKQWINSTFTINNVSMNQSCHDVPSQSKDPEELAEQEVLKQNVKWAEGRLLDDQVEEDSNEGDLSEGYEEEKVPDEKAQGEEVNVNGNANKGDAQIGESNTNKNDSPVETTGQHTRLQQTETTPNNIRISDPNSYIPSPEPVLAEPIDPGDTRGGRGGIANSREGWNRGEGD